MQDSFHSEIVEDTIKDTKNNNNQSSNVIFNNSFQSTSGTSNHDAYLSENNPRNRRRAIELTVEDIKSRLKNS